MSGESAAQLQRIYRERFERTRAYREQVWRILLSDYFSRYIRGDETILDLGCGYGEFINNVVCARKYAMDLNPDARAALDPAVSFLEQDCSERWDLPDSSLDLVFTSNFFEHLPSKSVLSRTLEQAWRCLKPGGRVIAMGPNIVKVKEAYWDFWDHHLPLSHTSLAEGMRLSRFTIESALPGFMPYTLVNAPRYPLTFLRLYLRVPPLWRLFGKQFLVVARK